MRRALLILMLFCASAAHGQVPPVIYSVTPGSATVGSATLTVTILGQHFGGGTAYWKGAPLTTTGTDGQLTVTIPNTLLTGTPGANELTVVTTSGVATYIFRLISSLAVVYDWTPHYFAPNQYEHIAIYGQNFTPDAVVYLDGIQMFTTSVTPTQITAALDNIFTAGIVAGTRHFVHVINGVPAPPTTGISLAVQPTAFGNQTLGGTATRTVTITNTGSSTVSLSAFTIGGVNLADFANPSSTCGGTLAASASCTASVTFTPSQTGVPESAFLTLTSSAVGSPNSVSLTGTGITATGATVGINPGLLAFGNVAIGGTSGLTLVLTDTGAPNYTTSSIALSGTNSGDFSVSPSSCSLVSNVSCNLAIGFAPTVNGPEVATLTITDNSTTSPNVISLSGTGFTPAPGATIVPSSIAFGDVVTTSASAPVTVSLINSGSQTYTISAIVVGGTNSADFAITGSGNCSTSTPLAPLQSCPIQVTYTPSGTSTESAYIQITDNATGSPRKLSLSGTGITSAHFMALTWTASNSPSVTGYNVYRGSQSGGPFTLLTPTPVSGTSYNDSAVISGSTYFYVITSVGTNPPYSPTESFNSSVVTGTIP